MLSPCSELLRYVCQPARQHPSWFWLSALQGTSSKLLDTSDHNLFSLFPYPRIVVACCNCYLHDIFMFLLCTFSASIPYIKYSLLENWLILSSDLVFTRSIIIFISIQDDAKWYSEITVHMLTMKV